MDCCSVAIKEGCMASLHIICKIIIVEFMTMEVVETLISEM